ncbi:GNAT family N-acetyltransferase [Bacillus sp. T33-2]|uniref:GNAT family N-acetyltransferase n=1 Tax=Bacillus sp. T33-2 TaxID=2054168 RepID=UPI000C755C46|nr:GNAT family N-acetyltransferase [Bacillus sp. T33-2]PLR95762.1 GNAT family N-acetyltransferase [Bacillus sp. T33-2]
MIEIRSIDTIDGLKNIQQLETRVWDMDSIPIHQTFTALKNGGIILGAYDKGKMIGFLYSFPGFRNGFTYLCSHMLGISPDYRKSGIGEMLKLRQKELAAEMGYSLIVWTYDPLESVNAYLNLHKLGGIAAEYHENYYQAMDDGLNQGLPTDRFIVDWWIGSPHANVKNEKTIEWEPDLNLIETSISKNHFQMAQKAHTRKVSDGRDCYFVPIPENIQAIKKADPRAALDWRLKTRETIQLLISKGYIATDVFRRKEEQLSYYVFKKREFTSIS